MYGLLLPLPTMQSKFINLVASALARLSLPMNHRIGAALGWIAWVTNSKLRTITLINLSLCFPDWTDEQRQGVAKASLIETGKTFTESFWVWKRPRSDVGALLQVIEGEEILRTAEAAPEGLIMATIHLGCWECSCLPLAHHGPVTCFYKPPRMSAIEPLILAGRKNIGLDPIPLDGASIKQVIKKLKNGHTVGILPDQEPELESGHFAPFFAHTANTMTLLAKTADYTHAQVLFCYAKRLAKGAGWHIHYLQPAKGVDSADVATATKALNQSIEQCVLRCPEQYMWSYKRFSLSSDGSRRNYKELP